MGRSTKVLTVSIYPEETEEEFNVNITKSWKEYMKKKYSIDFDWKVTEDEVEFKGKYMSGEVDDNIKALLETARYYHLKISGTVSYDDQQSGGAYHGIVYIAQDLTACICEFDIDVVLETLKDIPDRLECRKITLLKE